MKRSWNSQELDPAEYQISRFDIGGQHWYQLVDTVRQTRQWLDSVTKYTGHYPKGQGFYFWLAKQGHIGRANKVRDDAADKGNNIHAAFELLAHGKTPDMRDFTDEEQPHVAGLRNWFEDFDPTIQGIEEIVFSLRNRVAGTLDLRCIIKGMPCVADVKSGNGLYRSHTVQVNEYGVMSNGLGRDVEMAGLIRTGADTPRKYEWQCWPLCQKTHEVFEALLKIGRDFDPKTEPRIPRPRR